MAGAACHINLSVRRSVCHEITGMIPCRFRGAARPGGATDQKPARGLAAGPNDLGVHRRAVFSRVRCNALLAGRTTRLMLKTARNA